MLIKKISALILVLTVCAFSQINFLSNSICFRGSSNAHNQTTHYGDLNLSGTDYYDLSYGWLYSNAVSCNGWAWFNGPVTTYGDLTAYGSLNVYGTKNFIQPHPTDSTKIIKYVAIEAGEALTIARGASKTINGIAEIPLPEHFSLVTSGIAPITVLITPEKVPVTLFTQKKSKDTVVIAMKKSDYFEFGDAEFAYQVTGVRDGFENEQVILDIDNNGKMVDKRALSENRQQINKKTEKIMLKRKNSILKKNF